MTALRKWKYRFTSKERSKLDSLTAYELGEVLRLDDGTKGLIQLRNDLIDGGGIILSSHKVAVMVEKAIAAHALWKELQACREALKGECDEPL